MQVQDLGQISGEIVFFGGPYSNAQALEGLIAEAGNATLICTGDLVAYCAAPRLVAERVRDLGLPVVAGNCEKQLSARALDCGCGFEEGTTCDLLSAGWYAHASADIPEDLCDWMGTLPDVVTLTSELGRGAVIHGGVSDVARFIWSVSEEREFEEELRLINGLVGDVDFVISGHSGIAFERNVAGVRWINAGVIGMPPHDGTSQTEYLRATPDGAVRFEKLTYDVAGAVAKMEAVGLTQGYHKSLETGIWPSEDVLPLPLRR